MPEAVVTFDPAVAVQPPLDWLLRVLETTELRLTSLSPPQLSSLLCSLASLNLGSTLSPSWRAAYMGASLAALPRMSAADIAAMAGATLGVRLRPTTGWLAQLASCARGLEFDAQQELQLVEAISAYEVDLRAHPVVLRPTGGLKSRKYKFGAEVRV
ncbi:MAG: hypothetical protein WDW38_008947 [Sanguina aurantia]